MTSRYGAVAVVIAALSAVASGCGGGDPDPTSSPDALVAEYVQRVSQAQDCDLLTAAFLKEQGADVTCSVDVDPEETVGKNGALIYKYASADGKTFKGTVTVVETPDGWRISAITSSV